MRQVIVRRGNIGIEDIPAPLIEPGHVLVEVAYSLISTGTELSNVKRSGNPLILRAIKQPELVTQVMSSIRIQGIQKTVAKVRGKLDAGMPAGYSCSGIVIQTGKGINNIFPGDYVACSGSGMANHAEVVLVPNNLVTKVPSGCDLRSAASVTLGAIALQGVRRADLRIGEFVAVIGLGLLGQITVQLLVAQGCRVLGIDLDQCRVELARKMGAEYVYVPNQINVNEEINQISANHGVDATIITAASDSDLLVQQAMEITRRKGRVVIVGDVGLGLKRSPFYEKEIDFLISCSYGPGRYDGQYERKGLDYPYAYIRWTENRNMAEYLRLIATKKIQLNSIIEHEYDISNASDAYDLLRNSQEKPLGVLLSYSLGNDKERSVKLATRVTKQVKTVDGKIKIAIIGPGNFAKGVHLPNLQKLSDLYHIQAIVSRNGNNARSAAQQFGANFFSTNFEDVLSAPDIDAILISTPHYLHANQVTSALKAGKHVYCEKPLVIQKDELDNILACYDLSLSSFTLDAYKDLTLHPILMVGYNRRFSPAAQKVKDILSNRHNPLIIMYRVNAGYIPPSSWIQGNEGGGRIIGEMCHMFDLFNYWVEAPVKSISVEALTPHTESVLNTDNLSTTISYLDGSVCTLVYTALGSLKLGKEYIEIYVDGKTIVLDDFKSLRVYGAALNNWSGNLPDKGHKQALEAFAYSLKDRKDWPISLENLVEASRLSLSISEMVSGVNFIKTNGL